MFDGDLCDGSLRHIVFSRERLETRNCSHVAQRAVRYVMRGKRSVIKPDKRASNQVAIIHSCSGQMIVFISSFISNFALRVPLNFLLKAKGSIGAESFVIRKES